MLPNSGKITERSRERRLRSLQSCVVTRPDRGQQSTTGRRSVEAPGTSAWLEDAEYRQLCADLRADPVFAAERDAYDVATPLGSRDTIVTSAFVGEFRYRSVTLEAPGDFEHWLVVQRRCGTPRLWRMTIQTHVRDGLELAGPAPKQSKLDWRNRRILRYYSELRNHRGTSRRDAVVQ